MKSTQPWAIQSEQRETKIVSVSRLRQENLSLQTKLHPRLSQSQKLKLGMTFKVTGSVSKPPKNAYHRKDQQISGTHFRTFSSFQCLRTIHRAPWNWPAYALSLDLNCFQYQIETDTPHACMWITSACNVALVPFILWQIGLNL